MMETLPAQTVEEQIRETDGADQYIQCCVEKQKRKLQQVNAKLIALATTDGLTGLKIIEHSRSA